MVEPASLCMQRLPKKKVALIFGYCGTKYQGLQVNPNAYTVEDALWKALCDAECISIMNQDNLKKVGWIRCARTDKGVHALRQVVSFKTIMFQDEKFTVAKIQEKLPTDIRLLKMIRVTHSFNPKTACNSRIYEYLLPTYLLGDQWNVNQKKDSIKAGLDYEELKSAARQYLERNPYRTSKVARTDQRENTTKLSSSDEEEQEEQEIDDDQVTVDANENENAYSKEALLEKVEAFRETRKGYRLSPEGLNKLKETLSMFEGSHLYHNYTINKSPKDMNARRFILQCNVRGDLQVYHDTIEFVNIRFHGQSFMLHQIRKMISAAVLTIRYGVDFIKDSLTSDTFSIPKAPSAGLLLYDIVFDSYNKKCLEIPQNNENAREPFEWTDCKEAADHFQKTAITPLQVGQEETDNVYAEWLSNVERSIEQIKQ